MDLPRASPFHSDHGRARSLSPLHHGQTRGRGQEGTGMTMGTSSGTPSYDRSMVSSPNDLQQHLYASLLDGKTADVALRVRGSWDAIYRLHRVILIQAGFFRSLFTSGFAESHERFRSHLIGPEQVEIVFDDPNITRPAFEICIARLYGGGPPLHVPPHLVPTVQQPLTPGFPSPPPRPQLPSGHHPCSPRFLLSLLATAVYLSLPSVASHALTAIIGSVGPHTVVRYLNFAIGNGVGPIEGDEPGAAVGLEALALPVDGGSGKAEDGQTESRASDVDVDGISPVLVNPDEFAHGLEALELRKEDPSDPDRASIASVSSGHLVSASDADGEHGRQFDYGAVSIKIGEAAACWLARWGADILAIELGVLGSGSGAGVGVGGGDLQPPAPAFLSSGSRRRSSTMPSRSEYSGLPVQAVPPIWRSGGLSAKWATAVIASDMLFVKGEKARYEMAKDVWELRRKEGEDVENEHWRELFTNGIYYSTMSMEDLIQISRDVSPSTLRPYVPLPVIQSAHWNQSLLRQHIMGRPSGSSGGSISPPPRDKDLGVAFPTADLSSTSTSGSSHHQHDRSEKMHYVVMGDSSQRIGDSTGLEGASMDQLFDLASQTIDSKKAVQAVTSESTFFGLRADRHTAAGCIAADPSGSQRWSSYPPYRFAVEFWDVDALREKSRLHSHTVWYAGSLFNVYVQVVRKKGVTQLGVYLHRQSTVDPIPPASAPSPMASPALTLASPHTPDRDRGHKRGGTLPDRELTTAISLPSVHRAATPGTPIVRSTTPISTRSHAVQPGTPIVSSLSASALPLPGTSTTHMLPATAPCAQPEQPYRDPRPSVSAYFAIACASGTGASLTRFASAPDVFSVSQSWGWKSSSLRAEETQQHQHQPGHGEGGAGAGEGLVPSPREVSLRATVVLGVV